MSDLAKFSQAGCISPLDRFLSQSLLHLIREKLGEKSCEKIESSLQQQYGLSLAESMKVFDALDATLRRFFGTGAAAIEADFLEQILQLVNPRGFAGSIGMWMEIRHCDLVNTILSSYGDSEKRRILDWAIGQPSTISKILESCIIPKSSGYRIVNEMVRNGLLYEDGISITADGRKVSKYSALLQRVKIDLESKGKANLEVLVKEAIVLNSHILRVISRGVIV